MKKFYTILFFLPLFCVSQKQFEVFFDFNKDIPNEVSMRYRFWSTVLNLARWATVAMGSLSEIFQKTSLNFLSTEGK